jgi:hypothetical protein
VAASPVVVVSRMMSSSLKYDPVCTSMRRRSSLVPVFVAR